ncbi:calpastatin isoform X31 [Salmo salar]|uniref:Calpastatin n=1 Tax=Salmo salar TaxID=8030 RepID=A0A1S3L9T7_SALSA|nr:calpastatin isoform X31 [Salmo salar]|eukprot:XP_013987239.1 PREDICTED: calpastatin isoform X24 [Salmo salar]
MPHKKRSHAHGHHKKSPEQRTDPSTTLGEKQGDGRSYNTRAAAASKAQPDYDCCQCFKNAPKGYQELPSESVPPELFHTSPQPKQYSSTSVAQVAVNPAQFESASAASTMATKPRAESVTMGGATGSGVAAGGSPTTAGTTQRGAAKVMMPETTLVSPNAAGAGATIIDIPTPGTRSSPKDTPKTAPMHPAKATPPAPGGVNIVGVSATPWRAEVPKLQESPKQTAKSVPTTSSKADMAKKDPAKLPQAVSAGGAAAGGPSQKGPETKVQVEVGPPAAKTAKEELAADPFDALASFLPSSEPLAPAAPVYTGPEVIEHGLTHQEGVICGGNDCPLPPGYRFEDMAPVADVKPKDVPKPMSTEDALDSLSFGFTTSTAPIPQKQEKKVEDLAAIDALSAGFSNFAPPPPAPVKKAEFQSPVVTKSAAPPADKKAKVEKKAEFKSPVVSKSAAPPADKKAKVEKLADSPMDTKPKTDEGMSLDALDALGDTLAAPEPAPEPPKIRPEDIVTEGKLTEMEAVFVGERDDTLPPEYRFTEDKGKDLPPPKKEPSMDSGEALDILSGDFMSSSVAPTVQAPVLCPPAPPTQTTDDFALDALAGEFVAPAVAPAVKSAANRQLSTGTVDALDALSDTLMNMTPIPEPVPVSIKDIVKEKKIMEEKLIKMGERDVSLPAEYRPTEKDRKAMAEAKAQADVRPKQPSMDDSSALDLLSRDFSSSPGPAATSVVVTTKQTQPSLESNSKSRSKSKKQQEEDPSAKDHLSGKMSSDVVPGSKNKGGKS